MRESARVRANRLNAQKSRGPSTSEGKRRSSQNARRHNLSVFDSEDPAIAAEVDTFTRFIAGSSVDPLHVDAARDIALATTELAHVRRVRRHYLAFGWPMTLKELKKNARELTSIGHGLLIMAVYANARTIQEKQRLDPVLLVHLIESILRWGASSDQSAISDSSPIRRAVHRRVVALERYERRAVARRRGAITRFRALTETGLMNAWPGRSPTAPSHMGGAPNEPNSG